MTVPVVAFLVNLKCEKMCYKRDYKHGNPFSVFILLKMSASNLFITELIQS